MFVVLYLNCHKMASEVVAWLKVIVQFRNVVVYAPYLNCYVGCVPQQTLLFDMDK